MLQKRTTETKTNVSVPDMNAPCFRKVDYDHLMDTNFDRLSCKISVINQQMLPSKFRCTCMSLSTKVEDIT